MARAGTRVGRRVATTLLPRLFPRDVNHTAGLHQELAARLPARGRVLDLGCGANADLERYRTADREVWGADFAAHPGLRHPEWFRPLAADGSAPFPAAHFDLIASVMVLEHVADPGRFIGGVARLLRPGGVFVGHTINGAHYVTWLRRAVGLLPHAVNQRLVRRLYGRAECDTFPTHYRLNTPRAVRRAGAAAGLTLAFVRRYADPGYFRFSAATEAAAVLADRCLAGLHPAWGRLYLTVVLQKPRA